MKYLLSRDNYQQQCEERVAVLEAHIGLLAEALGGMLPRYSEMFVAAGLGRPLHSVDLQAAHVALNPDAVQQAARRYREALAVVERVEALAEELEESPTFVSLFIASQLRIALGGHNRGL